jgi:hypothetical protein
MLATTGAEFAKFQPSRVVFLAFGGGISSLLANRTGEMNDYSIFPFFGHFIV